MNSLKSPLSVRVARGIFVLMFLFEASLLGMSAHYMCQKFCGLCGYVPNEQLPDWVGLSVSPLVLFVLIGAIQSLHDSLEGEIRFADMDSQGLAEPGARTMMDGVRIWG